MATVVRMPAALAGVTGNASVMASPAAAAKPVLNPRWVIEVFLP